MIHANQFKRYKSKPMVVVTAYDTAFAAIAQKAGVDVILVGDSLANVMLGYKQTKSVDMKVMEIFTSAVTAGAKNTHIIADMPFGSYDNPESALINAEKFMSCGAHSVKIEGYRKGLVKYLTDNKVPVIGHVGLLPQTAESLTQVGNNDKEENEIKTSASGLEDEGAIAIVLEHLRYDLAEKITSSLSIPTIGIGAGKNVDGQVLVLHDLLGIHNHALPPFAKKFADVYKTSLKGLQDYCSQVREKKFP